MKKKKVIIILLVLLVVAALALVFTLKSRNSSSTVSTDDEMLQTETYEIEVGDYVIKYPTKWKDSVKVDVKKSTAAFSCGKDELFDLTFSKSGEDYLLGTLDGGKMSVYIKSYELNEKAKNYNDLCGMQEDINIILVNLQEDYDFEYADASSESSDNSATRDADESEVKKYTVESESAVLPMEYPEKWKDKVKITEKDNVVSFACGDVKLFDLYFKGCKDGYLLGTYDGKTKIYIVDYELDEKAENYDELCAMQEDVNVILQNWMEDKKFKVNA